MEALQQLSIQLIQALQRLSPALDGVMKFFTFLGLPEFYLFLAPFLYWSIDKRLGMRSLLILLTAESFTASFKLLFHQPRPYWIGDVKQLSIEHTYGIPSGHSSDSLAIGGFFAAQTKKTWGRVLIGIVLFFIALSRLYLAVHFLHDILFGWLIGAVVLWIALSKTAAMQDWFRAQSLGMQMGVSFLLSALIMIAGVTVRALIADHPDPASWSQFSENARSITGFFTLGGAFFGALSGYALMRRYVPFRPSPSWAKSVGSYFLGMVVLVLIYLGLDLVFAKLAGDETALGYALRYIRYAAMTLWVAVGAPWLFYKLNLVELEQT